MDKRKEYLKNRLNVIKERGKYTQGVIRKIERELRK